MLEGSRAARSRLWPAVDGGLFVLALGLGWLLRAKLPLAGLAELEDFRKYLWLAPVVAFMGPAVLASQGLYGRRLPGRWRQATAIARGCVFVTLGLILFLFLVREQFARSVVIFVGVFGGLLVFLRCESLRWFARTALGREQSRRRVVWIGTPGETSRWQAALASTGAAEGLVSIATFDPAERSADDLARSLREESINLGIVSLAGVAPDRMAPFLAVLEREGVEILLHPGLNLRSTGHLAVENLAGETVLYLRAQGASPEALLVKQAMDYALGGILALMLAPVLLALALAVRLTSPGPALFRQPRAGLNGRPFTMWKFRSMRADAAALQSGLANRNEMKGPVFKVADDPRVTPLGRWLRRHGLDELPQLWNVLRGEMSLVGPRPLPVEEVARFQDPAQRRRLSVKPGLTCLWQISGRNDIADFDEWVRLDLAYIDQWSLGLDLKILLATIPAVVFGRGGR